MAKAADAGVGADSYHHGDLRAALVRSALELIEEGDFQKLSLRKVAARAGVSNAAPYHHFAHKRDLLAALAAEAFTALHARLEDAIVRKRSPLRRFEAGAHAYLDFALENPAWFRLMSLPELAYVETPEGRAKLEAAQECFALLVGLVGAAASRGRSVASANALAVTVYATLQGFARLCLEGSFGADSREQHALQRAVVTNTVSLVTLEAAPRT